MIKKKRQIVIESSGLFVLGFLFFLASGLVFYLGASYGKSTRVAQAQFIKKDLHEKSQPPDIASLNVFKIKDQASSIKDYEKKLDLIDKSLKITANINPSNQKTHSTNNQQAKMPKDEKISAIKAEDIITGKNPLATEENSLVQLKDKDGFTIQIAAMQDAKLANNLLDKLRKDSFDAYISASPHGKTGIIYRVRVGSNLTQQQAKSILPTLEEKFAGLSVPTIEQYSN